MLEGALRLADHLELFRAAVRICSISFQRSFELRFGDQSLQKALMLATPVIRPPTKEEFFVSVADSSHHTSHLSVHDTYLQATTHPSPYPKER